MTRSPAKPRAWAGVAVAALLVLGLALSRIWPLAYGDRDRSPYAPVRQASDVWDQFDDAGAPAALHAAQSIGDPALLAYFRWRSVMDETGSPEERLSFAVRHLTWPGMRDLAKQILLDASVDLAPQQQLDLWTQVDDGSVAAALAQFDALKALNFQRTLQARVSAFWRRGEILDAPTRAAFLAAYGPLLTTSDHVRRFHALVGQTGSGKRLPTARLAAAAAALRTLIPPQLDRVRLAWALGTPATRKAVPEAWAHHAALVAQDVWAVQEAQPLAASALFRTLDPATANPSALWRLRRILIRNAIREAAYGEAYELAATHGFGTTTEGLTGELLAGWIALTYAKLPGLALTHYDLVADAAPGPWLRSKALRGQARALGALGRTAEAEAALRACADHQTTLFALLCLEDLGEPLAWHPRPRRFNPFPSRQSAARQGPHTQAHTFARVTAMLVAQDRSEREILPFARVAFDLAETPQQISALSAILEDRPDLVFTRTVGVMAARGTPAFHAPALPQIALDASAASKLSPALTHAVIAQESQFRASVRSRAGAVGLMQILPSTGRAVAADLDLRWDAGRLADPAFNVQLGQAYLASLLDDYDQALLLAAAAYNAGPARVKGWLRDFGDPREGEILPEDWIDAMTIGETRLYVQRVLTNLYLYRLAARRKDVVVDLQRTMVGR